MDYLWLTDERLAKISPHSFTDMPCKGWVDDRGVISGINQVRKYGGRWTDEPRKIYGRKETRYNGFLRWVTQGVWVELFKSVT